MEWGVFSFPSGEFKNSCTHSCTAEEEGIGVLHSCWMCCRGCLSLDTTCPELPLEPVFFSTATLGSMENCSNRVCFRNVVVLCCVFPFFLILPLFRKFQKEQKIEVDLIFTMSDICFSNSIQHKGQVKTLMAQ